MENFSQRNLRKAGEKERKRKKYAKKKFFPPFKVKSVKFSARTTCHQGVCTRKIGPYKMAIKESHEKLIIKGRASI